MCIGCNILLLCFPGEKSDDADGNMGSPKFSSTHVASNFVLGKLNKYMKRSL